jgi:hypothetical protein
MRRALADHVIETICDCLSTKAYYLKKPDGSWVMSTLLLFTPEGIVLQGDLTPEQNGSISTIGYGLKWFLGDLSEGYLCEKFLRKEWVQYMAAKELADPNSHWREEATSSQLEGLDSILNRIDDMEPGRLVDELERLGYEAVDELPGFGYDPVKAGWLCAIQQRFAEAWFEE